MKALQLLALGLFLCLAPACKREASPPAPPSAPASAPATAEPEAKAGHRKMANCPSSVAGAKTAHADIADGVDVTITATAPESVTEIRERARHLADVAVKNPDAPKHNGEGEGGGTLGQCPVVLNDTTLAAADVEGGVKVTIKPNKAENLDWLKKEVASRTSKPPM